jgi:hypothetical protein
MREVLFSELGGSALEARAYFLFGGKKKVAKEKATPGSAPRCAGSPALLGVGGGCGTRPCGPQTVLALFPPTPALLGASQGARVNQSGLNRSRCHGPRPCRCRASGNPLGPWGPAGVGTTDGGRAKTPFGAPLRGAEQRRLAGGLRLALSEPQASLARRPACRVAQGTGQRPAPTWGSPFLWLLSFGEAKESMPAPQARNPQVQKTDPAHQARNPQVQKTKLAHQARNSAFKEKPQGVTP